MTKGIYISTGGFSKFSADKISSRLIASGINSIELSGGKFSKNILENLNKLKKKTDFQIHNYFPPPSIPFVLNLASQDEEVARLSLNHVDHALECCVKLQAEYYSFHAGFLCDLKISELGKQIKKRKLYDREKSIELFLKRILSISKKAEVRGIKIMIENNVLSANNKKEFQNNPILMCNSKECLEVMKQVPKNVKLLIDVAHLKVSANSLKFDPKEMMNECITYVGGYHLSDNNGLSDTNKSFSKDSWFWKYLNPNLNYYSIEVYDQPINKLKKLKDMVSQNLSKAKNKK